MDRGDQTLGRPAGDEDNVSNVEGRRPAPPSRGFGQLWRKELSLLLPTSAVGEQVSAVDVMSYWKAHLHELWPDPSEVHRRRPWVDQGDLIGIDLGAGPAKLATGVLVIQSTPTSFAVEAPEGHMFAGWNLFTTEDTPEGTAARIVIQMRASDPLYEVGLMFGGHRAEERFWAHLLWNLARHFGVRAPASVERRLLDRHRQWRYAGNLRHNAFLHTTRRRIARLLGLRT